MDAVNMASLASGRWTRTERVRLSAICGVIGLLHLLGVALYLHAQGNVAAAGGLAGARGSESCALAEIVEEDPACGCGCHTVGCGYGRRKFQQFRFAPIGESEYLSA